MNLNYLLKLRIHQNLYFRRIILIINDLILITSSIHIGFYLYSNRFTIPSNQTWILWAFLLFTIPFYIITGQYKSITKYVRSDVLYKIAARNFILVLLIFLFGIIFQIDLPNVNIWILIWLLSSVFGALTRLILRDVLTNFKNLLCDDIPNVLIYGAGSAGAQLASSIRMSRTHRIEAFIDDCPGLWDRYLFGIPIRSPDYLNLYHTKVDSILLAIPSIDEKRMLEIVKKIKSYHLKIFKVPSITKLTSGESKINKLIPLTIEDLFCRQTISADKELLRLSITNRNVCVTGAAGSIGSELCRQIVKLNPNRLILIDISESNMYMISQELSELEFPQNKIFPILGSCYNYNFIFKTFKDYNINSVFHAAAYKHVPLVEKNPLQGIYNNVFSIKIICEIAIKLSIPTVMHISTDKAVRPSSVMGASKRLSELIVQNYAEKAKKIANKKGIKFSMVRFGNVLNSSGSVVPLFKKQINKGGPITLTHKDVIRYFMSIQEAAQLVLQAASLAKGGEVFLLDMGEPVKIYDLAVKMIQLEGLTVKNNNNPNGDIEIVTSGLRTGEKLFEELLVEKKSIPSSHPLIFYEKEQNRKDLDFIHKIEELHQYLLNQDKENSIRMLSELVPEWKNSEANY